MRGRFRTTKRVLFHLAVRGLQGVARILPRRLALPVFAGAGDLVRLVDRPAVRRSLAHLEIAFGSVTTVRQRRAIVCAMFRSTGRNLVDVLRPFPRDPRRVAELVRFEGLEHLDAALRRGRGVVAISGHVGNWEVLGAALASRGYPIHVVAREVFDRRSDVLLNRWRTEAGVFVHPRGRGLLRAARALRDGHVVGALVDQDTAGRAVFAEFFGRAACTPSAPFTLARRTGAALVPMWVRMDPSGRHVVRVAPALERSPDRSAEALLAADVAAWHRLLEDVLRSYPDQWVWHHRRWKTRPRATVADPSRFSPRLTPGTRRRASTEVAVTR